MKTMMTAAAGIGLAAMSAAGPAMAQAGPPLTMTCHLLLAGFPQPDKTAYMVIGNEMFAKGSGHTTRIARVGVPLFLGRTIDKGVPTLSYADHRRAGRVVTRRVYWQAGARPRRLAFTERYDFVAQTITTSGERGDSCHHNGR